MTFRHADLVRVVCVAIIYRTVITGGGSPRAIIAAVSLPGISLDLLLLSSAIHVRIANLAIAVDDAKVLGGVGREREEQPHAASGEEGQPEEKPAAKVTENAAGRAPSERFWLGS